MKLKTLKDFEWRAVWEFPDGGKGYAISLPELKKVLIEWAKDVEASRPYEELSGPEAVIQFIKIFGNIKEEDDLKWIK